MMALWESFGEDKFTATELEWNDTVIFLKLRKSSLKFKCTPVLKQP